MTSNRKPHRGRGARLGLVSEVVEADALAAPRRELARLYAACRRAAIGLTKRLFDHAYDASLEEQLELEAELQQPRRPDGRLPPRASPPSSKSASPLQRALAQRRASRPPPGSALTLLREDELTVVEHVELALRALDDRGGMPLVVQDGRETRGPAVVAASDGAVVDLDGHGREPTRARRGGARSRSPPWSTADRQRPEDAARRLEPERRTRRRPRGAVANEQRALERDREQLEQPPGALLLRLGQLALEPDDRRVEARVRPGASRTSARNASAVSGSRRERTQDVERVHVARALPDRVERALAEEPRQAATPRRSRCRPGTRAPPRRAAASACRPRTSRPPLRSARNAAVVRASS